MLYNVDLIEGPRGLHRTRQTWTIEADTLRDAITEAASNEHLDSWIWRDSVNGPILENPEIGNNYNHLYMAGDSIE